MAKKAQVEMIEMIVVLFIFFILLAIGLYFYYSYSSKSIRSAGEESKAESGIVLISGIPFMPDFQCSFGGSDEGCVDSVKVLSFDAKRGRKSLFANKKIYIRRVFPPPDNKTRGVLCDASKFNELEFPYNCGYLMIKDFGNASLAKRETQKFSTPVSLYYPPNNYIIGELWVEVVM